MGLLDDIFDAELSFDLPFGGGIFRSDAEKERARQQKPQPTGPTITEALGGDEQLNTLDALMASSSAKYVESLRSRDLKNEPISTDDLLTLYTFQNYNKLPDPQKNQFVQQVKGSALTTEFDRLLREGSDDEIQTFMDALGSGENKDLFDAFLTGQDPTALDETGLAEQEELIRMQQLEYERAALLDFVDLFPAQVKGQVILKALEIPDIQAIFFPGLVKRSGGGKSLEDLSAAFSQLGGDQ